MDLQHEVVLAYIEEDDIRNGYFRAFPMLTPSGDIREEAKVSWPDDGALRIIPDRKDHFSFKERMRELGSWCMIDLKGFDMRASKIRTNKNYNPERGERNHFIVFSDTVFALQDGPFAEVLDGTPAQAAQLAAKSVTPLFYVKDGDTWYGPVRKAEPAEPKPAAEFEANLYRITAPDGAEHCIVCADVTQQIPIGQSLEILDQTKSFEETIEALSQPLSEKANLIASRQEPLQPDTAEGDTEHKLSGTPLVRTSFRASEPPLRNRVQEIVSGRAVMARNAEPPAPPVPFSTDLPIVENPVEKAEAAFRKAWMNASARPALAHFLLSLEGMKPALDNAAANKHNTALASALRYHLENLEVERLRLLIELDHAKEDMAAFRAKAIEEASQKTRRELDKLRRDRDSLADAVERLKAEADELLVSRQNAGVQIGISLNGHEILHRVESAFGAEALPYQRENAAAWLALMSRPCRVAILSHDIEAATRFAEKHAAILGWPCTTVQDASPVQALPCAIPVIRVSLEPDTEVGSCERVIVVLPDREALAQTDLPVMPVGNLRYTPPAEADKTIVGQESLQAILDEAPISAEEARAALAPVFTACGLPDDMLDKAAAFAAVAAGLFDGGMIAACDWALALWVAPRVPADGNRETVLTLLEEYPRTRALVG
ncbi:MAG: hypothetical protein IK127_05205 [Clostridia bacterium]|nr:hypothetical protein [Clostridia bacterium]